MCSSGAASLKAVICLFRGMEDLKLWRTKLWKKFKMRSVMTAD